MRININSLKNSILIRCLEVQLSIRLVKLNALLMNCLNDVLQIEHFIRSIQVKFKEDSIFPVRVRGWTTANYTAAPSSSQI